jgi:hypothetical protein
MPPLWHDPGAGCFLCACPSIAYLDVFVPKGPPFEPVAVALCAGCFGKTAAIEDKIVAGWHERMRPGARWWLVAMPHAEGTNCYCLCDRDNRHWLAAFTSLARARAFVETGKAGRPVGVLELPESEFLDMVEGLAGGGLAGVVRDPRVEPDGTTHGHTLPAARVQEMRQDRTEA